MGFCSVDPGHPWGLAPMYSKGHILGLIKGRAIYTVIQAIYTVLYTVFPTLYPIQNSGYLDRSTMPIPS